MGKLSKEGVIIIPVDHEITGRVKLMRHPRPADRLQVQQWARELLAGDFYILDTETTGIGKEDEIIQIGIVNRAGKVVVNQLVRPTRPVPAAAQAVHGISNEMLASAPAFDDVFTTISIALSGSIVVAYNMDFDWRMLTQTLALAPYSYLPQIKVKAKHCAMKQYAAYRGVSSPKGGYRWHKLGQAAADEGIEVQNAHDAVGDVLMTLRLIEKMAQE
jgi:DNA polymerase III epsilon subunit-like protein